jgi:hypothetical protein
MSDTISFVLGVVVLTVLLFWLFPGLLSTPQNIGDRLASVAAGLRRAAGRLRRSGRPD